MTVPTERTLEAQLSTALLVWAQFVEQLTEWEQMGAKRRKRTARGRDLASRLDGLHAGRAKWEAKVADLQARIAAQADADTTG